MKVETSQLSSGKMNEVLAVLQQGFGSATHQESCQRLLVRKIAIAEMRYTSVQVHFRSENLRFYCV
jgi:hypothetical protein